MKRFIAALALLFAASAFGQSYPSPTYNNLTVQGNATLGSHVAITGGTITGLTSPLPIASGGTNSASASGTALDNITGFVSTGFLTRTGAGAYSFQSLTNGISYGNLAQAAANTVLGNATGSTANVTAITVTGCNGAAQALQWTNGSGFGCNSAIATSGANANITSLSGLTTPLSAAQGGTGSSSLAAFNLLAGNGTGAVSAIAPSSTSGFVLMSNGSSALPTFQTAPGRLIGVQVFTSSGTYTPDTGTNSVVVEVQAGGGGGGGSPAAAAGQQAAAAGGSAGGYSSGRITSAFSGVTVTVGAVGTGGAAGSNAGGSGGSSSFGTLIVCTGGGGGGSQSVQTAFLLSSPTAGGTTTTAGNIASSSGQVGAPGLPASSTNSFGGNGAPSYFGGGAMGTVNGGAGASAVSRGAGGGGASTIASGAAAAGGSGGAGLVIVWEYN